MLFNQCASSFDTLCIITNSWCVPCTYNKLKPRIQGWTLGEDFRPRVKLYKKTINNKIPPLNCTS